MHIYTHTHTCFTGLTDGVFNGCHRYSNWIGGEHKVAREDEVTPNGVDVHEDEGQEEGEDDGGDVPGHTADDKL